MANPATEPVIWLAAQTATAKAGVHRITLNRWAAEGKIEVKKTPGGHRRFREDQMVALGRTRRKRRGVA